LVKCYYWYPIRKFEMTKYLTFFRLETILIKIGLPRKLGLKKAIPQNQS